MSLKNSQLNFIMTTGMATEQEMWELITSYRKYARYEALIQELEKRYTVTPKN